MCATVGGGQTYMAETGAGTDCRFLRFWRGRNGIHGAGALTSFTSFTSFTKKKQSAIGAAIRTSLPKLRLFPAWR